MLKTKLKFHFKLVIAVILTLGLSISIQSGIAAWQAPSATPPSQPNIFKPINVGPYSQTKSGTLKLLKDLEVSRDLTVVNQVGIGIFNTTPTGPNLYIQDDMADLFLDSTDNTSASFISLLHSGIKQWSIGENPFWSLGDNDFYIYGQTPGKGLFIKKDTGNVGIGEMNPTAQLFIQTGNPVALEVQSTDNFARVHLEGTSGTIISAGKGGDTTKKFNLQSAGDGASGAFLGLYGRTNSSYPGGVIISSATAGSNGDISLQTRGSSRLFIENGGNVGIATTNPNANLKLDVEGRVGATEYCDEDGNNCVDASTGLGGGGSAQIECATVRRYENNSIATSLIDYTAGFTTPLSEVYIDDDSNSSIVPAWHSDSVYGFQCNESNEWVITGCAHAQSGGSGDSDVFMDNNGCYAGRNDGDQNRNSLDMRCCRVVGGGGGASINTGDCQDLSTGIDTNTWTDCPAGYVITGFMAGYGHSSDYNQDHKIRCCKLQ